MCFSGKVVSYEHAIPRGGWFDYVSCPHYLMEIIIYLSFLLIGGPRHVTLLSVVIFVITNQLVAGYMTHRWYCTHFGSLYPAQRKAVIPFLLWQVFELFGICFVHVGLSRFWCHRYKCTTRSGTSRQQFSIHKLPATTLIWPLTGHWQFVHWHFAVCCMLYVHMHMHILRNYDVTVIPKNRLCQLMHIYLKNNLAKFCPDLIWNDRVLGLLKRVAPRTRTTRWVVMWDHFLVV